jgi:CDP-diglyceride synthetase
MSGEQDKIRITSDDVQKVRLPAGGEVPAEAAQPGAEQAKNYGNIADAHDEAQLPTAEEQSIFLKSWFYLGASGMLGATLAWAVTEPWFSDVPGLEGWGNYAMLPLMVIMICVGMGIAESIAERAPRKALIRGGISLGIGLVVGIGFDIFSNIIFAIGIGMIAEMGVQSVESPAFWVVRSFAWMVFGVAAGVIYGIVGRSPKKTAYGVIGGVIGSGVGGLLFDPIALAVDSGGLSRALGFGLFGLATGVSVGLVESALKDRWLHVTGGPLAGKQFILYKPLTSIGSDQQCDIYLFKDPTILARHATITVRGVQTILDAAGAVFVAGQPARQRTLRSGDLIQIGRYSLFFREKRRET